MKIIKVLFLSLLFLGSINWVFCSLKVKVFSEQVKIKKDGKLYQLVSIKFDRKDDEENVKIYLEDNKDRLAFFDKDNKVFYLLADIAEKEINKNICFEYKGAIEEKVNIKITPVRDFTIYILHHSHNDIGYSDIQDVVLKKQLKNLDDAVEMSEKTKDYPEGSKFKWNVEILWAVEAYLSQASESKKEKFIKAVKEGRIGLQALFTNQLTGVCRPSERYNLFECMKRISQQYNISIPSAMISDVPGLSWAMVSAFSSYGVKYLSSGQNYVPILKMTGERVGFSSIEWGDRPFYWISQSNQDKILYWIAGKGYSWFFDWLVGKFGNQIRQPVWEYLRELTQKNYPYDLIQLRYTVSDNGPIDSNLSDFVKTWNEEFASPKFIISTSEEMFSKFEEKYSKIIPSVSGDFTPYWEDGVASSAIETGLNRVTTERLTQVEVLFTLLDLDNFPSEKFYEAWKNAILFDEHTWGASNSVSEPESDFAKTQWRIKKDFALHADKLSKELLTLSLQKRIIQNSKTFDVFNSNSFMVSDIITITKETALGNVSVKGENGEYLLSQTLSDGSLAVLVENVPALTAKRIYLTMEKMNSAGSAKANNDILENEFIKVRIGKSGSIESFYYKKFNQELVDNKNFIGLNQYLYIKGRKPNDFETNEKGNLRIAENGPLFCSIIAENLGEGSKNIIREYRIYSKIERLDIIDKINKLKVLEKEGVHIAFPLNIKDGIIRIDNGIGFYRPEYDQLVGSCKDYFCVQRWIDISNQDLGVTLLTIESPLVEITSTVDERDRDNYNWIKKVNLSQTVFSYIMNNYWHTNYKAYQENETIFRYSIVPHGRFESYSVNCSAIQKSQPLQFVPVDENSPKLNAPFNILSNGMIINSIKPDSKRKSILINLFNASGRPEKLNILWKDLKPKNVFISNSLEEEVEKLSENYILPAFGTVILKAIK